MLSIKRVGFMGAVAALAVACAIVSVPAANATTSSDDAAAILVWPKIVADDVGVCVTGDPNRAGRSCDEVACDAPGDYCKVKDTLIEIASLNPSQQTAAHCFYVNCNSHCSNDGSVCTSSLDCTFGDDFVGVCEPGCSELNFDVRITPNQPLAWSALQGLSGPDLPLRANAGTRVPPVPETPFLGELKCVQVDPTSGDRLPAVCDAGTCRNDLIGEAQIEEIGIGAGSIDPKWYNAVGIRNDVGNDGNGVLSLNGDEYEPCPGVLVLNHLFDGAVDPISQSYPASTELTLGPCSEDLLTQTFPPVTAQFLVYNEFEQRFSTSVQVSCLLDSVISRIGTSQPERSIFWAGVAGTVAGQTRIKGVNGGLLGVAVVNFGPAIVLPVGEPRLTAGAAYNLNQVGGNAAGDVITIP